MQMRLQRRTQGGRSRPSPQMMLDLSKCVYTTCPPSLESFTKEFQNETVAIYVSSTQQQIVISFRGTKMSTFSQVYGDVLQGWSGTALNQLAETPRYTNDLKLIEEYIARYPGYTIFFTGHSLGGALAQQALRDLKGEAAMVFNSAYQPQDRLLTDQQVTRFHTPYDPLAKTAFAIGLGSRIKTIGKKSWSSQAANVVATSLGLGGLPYFFRRDLQGHKLKNFQAHRSQLQWH